MARATFRLKVLLLAASLLGIFLIYVILFATYVSNDAYAEAGGAVGAVSSLFVVIKLFPVRQLSSANFWLFWRSVTDLGFGLRFVVTPAFNLLICGDTRCNRYTANNHFCPLPSAMFEFFAVAGEAWNVCNSFDLYWSVQNPFWDYRSRIKVFHGVVWSLALFVTILPFVLGLWNEVYGFWYVSNYHDESAICWLKVTNIDRLGIPLWALFVGPLLLCFIGFIAVIVVYLQLSKGLSKHFLPKLHVIAGNSANVVTITIFWFLFFMMYALVFFTRHEDSPRTDTLFNILIFSFASKGYVDFVSWLLIADMTGVTEASIADLNKVLREEILSLITAGIRSTARDGPINSPNTAHSVRKLMEKPPKNFSFFYFLIGEESSLQSLEDSVIPANDVLARLTIEEPVEVTRTSQLRPSQQNAKLSEIELGIRKSAMLFPVQSDASTRVQGKSETERNFFRKIWTNLGISIDMTIEFVEVEPFHYRRVRLACGIDDEFYIDAFTTTLKERLTSGGASGALFFFSKNEVFIAKSCSASEISVLREHANVFADYMEQNPNTYIGKILGVYELYLSGIILRFFVTNNIFPNSRKLVMREVYDLKGSWVARNAVPPFNGESVTCRYCEQKFTYYRNWKRMKSRQSRNRSLSGLLSSVVQSPLVEMRPTEIRQTTISKELEEISPLLKCQYTVNGIHEPKVVMKDNDLKDPLRISPEQAGLVLSQLRRDCDFLCQSMGVMDYSLLLGVHHSEYDLSKLQTMTTGNPSMGDGPRKDNCLEAVKVVGPDLYWIGIIDFLQTWNQQKKMERWFKVTFQGADSLGLSAIAPDYYKERFLKKVEELLNIRTMTV